MIAKLSTGMRAILPNQRGIRDPGDRLCEDRCRSDVKYRTADLSGLSIKIRQRRFIIDTDGRQKWQTKMADKNGKTQSSHIANCRRSMIQGCLKTVTQEGSDRQGKLLKEWQSLY